jgi:multiple sugar transport system substrate-binding protein
MTEKLSRREFLKMTGVIAAGTLLSACGATTAAPTVSTDAEVPGDEAAAKDPVTLSVLNIWGGTRVPLMEDMFTRFSDKYPWITVENVLVPGGERLQKIQTSIAGGTPPDCPMIGQSEIPMFAIRKALIPLDTYMAQDGVAYEDYYDYAIEASQWQSMTYSLPNVSSAYHLYFYNVNAYEEAGLDPDNPPTVWDEFTEASVKLTKKEGDRIERLGYQFYHGLPNLHDFTQALVSNNGKFFSDDGRKVEFNSSEGVEALRWCIDTMKAVYGTVDGFQEWGAIQGAEDITNPFIAETLASRYAGVWEIFFIIQGKPDLNYKIGQLPHSPKGKSHAPAIGSWSYGVPTGAAHPDDSWLLVKWLTHEPSAAGWFMQQQGRPSPLKGVNEDQYYYDTFPDTWPAVLEMAINAVRIPITPASTEVDRVVGQALEEVAYGTRDLAEALEWAEGEAQELLDEAWAEVW